MKKVVIDTNIIISSALGGALVFVFDHLNNVILSVAKDLCSRMYETLRAQKARPQSDMVF